jgi:hypothetical protein
VIGEGDRDFLGDPIGDVLGASFAPAIDDYLRARREFG